MGLCESVASVSKDDFHALRPKLRTALAENSPRGEDGQADCDMVDVRLPLGAEPGAIVQISISDGRLIEVTVPAGSKPGDTIKVKVPRLKQQSRWASLHDAFLYLDPGHTGFITDHARFAEVARLLAGMDGKVDSIWSTLDQDGNGCVNWPEFVEWAESHHVSLPSGIPGDDGKIAFPSTWTGPKDDPKWIKREDITDPTHFMELDELLKRTYKNVWTRDRKATGVNKVPKGYELIKAERCENVKDWRRYYMKRHQLAHACSQKVGFIQRKALTGNARGICTRQHLRSYCNEWLLFHGTSKKAADSILSGAGDFVISLAGSATGTLYGKGTYFAESITKADEYAKVDDTDGLCCVLVCRVVGGHVLYNDEVTPDPDELQNRCISGEHHSIIGDREKCRNTFKEYVIFDADQVYVEYALYYKRLYS